MREYYYTPLGTDNRPVIIDSCLAAIQRGRKVIYIAPSREVIFDVRKRLADALGGVINAFVGGFDDLEAELLREESAGRLIDTATALAVLAAICRARASFAARRMRAPLSSGDVSISLNSCLISCFVIISCLSVCLR